MKRFTEKLRDGRNIIRDGIYYFKSKKYGCFFEGKAVDKLSIYENTEDIFRSLYGEDPKALDEYIRLTYKIIQSVNGRIEDVVVITGEGVDKWNEWNEAHEQGRLLCLPCKVGDTVYSVSFKKKCVETEKNGGYLINQNIDCAFCENENCKSKETYFVEEITATLPIIANIILEKDNDSDDFMIYLTREEAERKLKEMEAKENAEET